MQTNPARAADIEPAYLNVNVQQGVQFGLNSGHTGLFSQARKHGDAVGPDLTGLNCGQSTQNEYETLKSMHWKIPLALPYPKPLGYQPREINYHSFTRIYNTVGRTMINDYQDRHHPFEGCFNFRDIGGYPTKDGHRVRWGLYFRAGRQDRMTNADLLTAQNLGIKAQIDLRRPDEAQEQGRGPFEAMGATYYNLPVIPEGGSEQLSRLVGDTNISGERYLGYLEFGSETWVQMFSLFENADSSPMVLHCTAGKDRTGVSTAFLLSVLGVDRAIIEADYLLTNVDVERQVDFIEANIGLPEGMDRAALMHAAGVPEDAMRVFLDGLDTRWGGPIEYLRSIGITDDSMAKIRDIFIDTNGGQPSTGNPTG